MDRHGSQSTRRAFLRGTTAAAAVGLAGCRAAPGDEGGLLAESFESASDRWSTDSAIGPEEPDDAFEWSIERSQEQAAAGEWSLEIFTEGDHDDGTAWAVTEVPVPDGASSFEATLRAWSEAESFNLLRHLVAYLGPERPTGESDFPDPGINSGTIAEAPYGGFREPLHLAEGWREYSFSWDPSVTLPETLYFAVGVSVVWEAGATHYVDEIDVVAE